MTVTRFQDLPPADRARDGAAAGKRVRAWAGAEKTGDVAPWDR
jgi:hypothetical protein